MLIQLGGPGMRIGMGGGAASSMASGTNAAELDFDSVQRGNPRSSAVRRKSSTTAGSRAPTTPSWPSTTWGRRYLQCLPELTNDAGRGARFDLRAVKLEESGLAPGNLVQRIAGALCDGDCARIAGAVHGVLRARALPFAVIGTATEERQLVLEDTAVESGDQKFPVDMPMEVLLGKPPKMHKDVTTVTRDLPAIDLTGVPLEKAVIEVLAHPTVASKRFLITIGDRAVGGLTHRDQMVGLAGARG